MMRRVAGLFTALALLLTAAGCFAETAPDLYDLYDSTEQGEQWIGTAVPVLDGVLIASSAAVPDSVKSLKIWNGAEYMYAASALPAAGGSLLVILADLEDTQPSVPYYPFAEMPEIPDPGQLLVRSGDWMRSRVNRAVYGAAPITWQGLNCLVLTLSGETDLGAPLLTAGGELAGIVAAEYAEGGNRYVAVTVRQIAELLQEIAARLYGENIEDTRPEGYTVTLDNNEATFDWTDVKLPEVPEGQQLYHIVADAASSYLTFNEVKPGEDTKTSMLLTPGRTYISGLAAADADRGPSELPERYAVTTLPEAEPLTDYSFRSVRFAIAEMAEDAAKGAMPVPVEKVTEELLRGGRGCIYSLSTYDVDTTKTSIPMLIALTAPDGSNYRYESGWYYDASLKEGDEWYVPLADTGLLELLNETGYPEGVYEVAMYIGGKLADSFTFELTK